MWLFILKITQTFFHHFKFSLLLLAIKETNFNPNLQIYKNSLSRSDTSFLSIVAYQMVRMEVISRNKEEILTLVYNGKRRFTGRFWSRNDTLFLSVVY